MSQHDNRIRLEPGTRVRSVGHAYLEALLCGSAVITDVLGQHPTDQTWKYRVRVDRTGNHANWNMVDTAAANDDAAVQILADTPRHREYRRRAGLTPGPR